MAINIERCFEAVSDEQHEIIFTLLLSIFGEPDIGCFQVKRGRSSRLAGLIANALIRGEKIIGPAFNADSLESSVFSASALDAVKDQKSVYLSSSPDQIDWYCLDRTRAIRVLLHRALNDDPFQSKKSEIQQLAKTLADSLKRPIPEDFADWDCWQALLLLDGDIAGEEFDAAPVIEMRLQH